MKLGFLASHKGSNMQAIIDACHNGKLAAEPVVVISNNAGSGALKRARRQNIPAVHLGGNSRSGAGQLDTLIRDTLSAHGVDLVVLAGYMKKIGPVVLAAYHNRIINIHPSLLPAHGGKGMYGKRVHAAVLAAGDKETGASVHLVDEYYDNGRVLARARIAVDPSDTVDSLAARVLDCEHELFVNTIAGIISGEIKLQ